jgi:hypothetical protein
MAWRPNKYLIEGELDNTQLGKVTGWMQFAGMKGKVTFDLEGNFHRDIRGAKIRFKGNASGNEPDAKAYMEGFAKHQTGKVGDMTAGLPPADYVSGCVYLEWYGDHNGRIVIELEQSRAEVIGTPLLASQCEPISRQEQDRNMMEHLQETARQPSGKT